MLLERIDSLGSLSPAALSMNLPYAHAWNWLDADREEMVVEYLAETWNSRTGAIPGQKMLTGRWFPGLNSG